jgi:hypothetical protein
MSLVAAIRPDSWNVALLVHVLGALVLVGGLVASIACLAFARGDTRLLRYGWLSLFALSLPGWIVMRAGAEWIYSKEGWNDLPSSAQPTWLDIGFIVADLGGIILLIGLVLGGLGVRRLRTGGGAGLVKATLVVSTVLLAADLVAVWAMSGKPS